MNGCLHYFLLYRGVYRGGMFHVTSGRDGAYGTLDFGGFGSISKSMKDITKISILDSTKLQQLTTSELRKCLSNIMTYAKQFNTNITKTDCSTSTVCEESQKQLEKLKVSTARYIESILPTPVGSKLVTCS